MNPPILTATESVFARHTARRIGWAAALGAPGTTVIRAGGRQVVGGEAGTEPDTIFEIGPLTALFTGLLFAWTVVRGELELTTPVASLTGGPDRSMTLLDLATHSSRGWWRDRIRYRYSAAGMGLLGALLVRHHRAAGYGELVDALICRPLRMTDTVVVPSDEQWERRAVGHRGRRPASYLDVPAGLAGACALNSTVLDLVTFLRAHAAVAAGRAVHAGLPPDLADAIALTQTPHHRFGPALATGLGWHVHEDLSLHTGGTRGFASFVGLVPATGVYAVVLSNAARDVTAFGTDLIRVWRPDSH